MGGLRIILIAALSLFFWQSASSQQSAPKYSNIELAVGGVALYYSLSRGLDQDPRCKMNVRHEDPEAIIRIVNMLAQKDGNKEATKKQISELRVLIDAMLAGKLPDGKSVMENTYTTYKKVAIDTSKTLSNEDYCSVLRTMASTALQGARNAIAATPSK